MPKTNVFNYELEGFEWDYCPSLLMYTREAREEEGPTVAARP